MNEIKTQSPEIQTQIKETLELLKRVFGRDLKGVYLYGSALLGGLQRYSDIDLLVVANRSTTLEEKGLLVDALLKISGIYMKEAKPPLEVTIVEKRAITPWRYPPLFDFQYGEWLRTSFESGNFDPWPNHEMADLALIITQVLLKSQTIWGERADMLLPKVPYSDFMKAMIHDVDRLSSDLEHDTRNVLLTYARIWSTLETQEIRSKPSAADWALSRLPMVYQPILERAKSICIGQENEHWEDIQERIKPCAGFIVDKINQYISLMNFQDPSKSIKLAD